MRVRSSVLAACFVLLCFFPAGSLTVNGNASQATTLSKLRSAVETLVQDTRALPANASFSSLLSTSGIEDPRSYSAHEHFGYVDEHGLYTHQITVRGKASLPRVINLALYDAIEDEAAPVIANQCSRRRGWPSTGLLQTRNNRTASSSSSLVKKHSRSQVHTTMKPPVDVIGTYEKSKMVGKGAFGEVWEYTHSTDNNAKSIIVKFPKTKTEVKTKLDDESMKARDECDFARELQKEYNGCFLFMNCYQVSYSFTGDEGTNQLYMVLESGLSMHARRCAGRYMYV